VLPQDKKIDVLTEMMQKMAAASRGTSDPADMDPKVLAEIAKAAGMEANEAMKNELGQMSTRMEKKADEILDAVQVLSQGINRIDEKLGLQHESTMSSIDNLRDLQVQTSQELARNF
jgi:uncharacterized protein YqgV (UPF0045/DUF77 family)